MDHLLFESADTVLGFVGRIHTGRKRPAVLAVNGSFPSAEFMHDLVDRFAGANVLVANLPGMAGVYWAKATLAQMTQSLEEAVGRLLPDAPIVALGISTGNLVSLGLQSPNICRRVALEPFFQTQDLWPFIENSRERMALNRVPTVTAPLEYMEHFFWEIFGIAPDRLENRDYRRLLASFTVPTDVLTGALPLLPPRELSVWPSFTSAEDRALLAANPLVTMHEGPPGTGHAYGAQSPGDRTVQAVVEAALRDAARLCA